jgi:hypothetical protein
LIIIDNEPQQPEVVPQAQNDFQVPVQTTPQPIVTEEPLLGAPTPTPAVQPKPKKSHKGLIYAIIALLLIGGGVAAGWLLFGKDDTSSKQTQLSTSKTTATAKTTPTVAALKPEDVTSKIKTTLATQYTLVDASSVPKLQKGQVSVNTQTQSPAYKTAGYNFYNSYAGGSTLYLTSYYVSGGTLPTAPEAAIRSEIAKIYTNYGMKMTATYGSTDAGQVMDVYTSNDLICTVDNSSNSSSPTTASCGLMSAYKAAAEQVKPFADVITGITPSTNLGVPVIKDSKVSGYQTASISSGDIEGMGGHVELFYRKTSGAWKYFTGTQSELACSMYNTTDLKNAYKGEPCWNTTIDKDSTVQ